MKKILMLGVMFVFWEMGATFATTVDLNWNDMIGDTNYSQSICTVGDDLNIPNVSPVKNGRNFVGWAYLSNGYTELQYITGGIDYDAYIDLGFAPTPTMQTLLVASIGVYSAGEQVLMGVSDATGFANGKPYAIDIKQGSAQLYLPNGKTGDRLHILDGFSTEINTIYQFKVNYPTIGTVGVNDVYKTAFTDLSSVATRNLYVFYYNGTSPSNNAVATVHKMNLYRLIIWDNYVIAHYYIPAKNSNDVIGLYDAITGIFLTNVGSGGFVAGPVVNN